jgi:hypothetical protein
MISASGRTFVLLGHWNYQSLLGRNLIFVTPNHCNVYLTFAIDYPFSTIEALKLFDGAG